MPPLFWVCLSTCLSVCSYICCSVSLPILLFYSVDLLLCSVSRLCMYRLISTKYKKKENSYPICTFLVSTTSRRKQRWPHYNPDLDHLTPCDSGSVTEFCKHSLFVGPSVGPSFLPAFPPLLWQVWRRIRVILVVKGVSPTSWSGQTWYILF